ncbi:phosphotransferase [Streptomyces sp. NPDC006798]|uniref:phosphotransferase n=1 Tax=Streptomyces sp. NPDC006798 TaxID=3155462 RepID=UPI0033F4AFFA
MPRSYDNAVPPVGALLRRYDGPGEPLTCEPVTQGLLNRGYRLATTHGAYFLKHHLDGDLEAIARQHRATRLLEALGVPVAPAVADARGDTVAVIGGHCYALHPWVDGRHRDGAHLSTLESQRLGALLGLVHNGLEQVMSHQDQRPGGRTGTWNPPPDHQPGPLARLPGPQRGPLDRPPGHQQEPRDGGGRGGGPPGTGGPYDRRTVSGGAYDRGAEPGGAYDRGAEIGGAYESADPRETFSLIDELLALIRAAGPRDSFDLLAEHRLLERRTMLELHADLRPPAASAGGWVHGDFHPLNLLYRGAEPAAIVDWDRLGVQPRAEEAVRAAAIFFVRPEGALELPKVRAYARAYRHAVGADTSELDAAVHRVWWERLNDFWILRWRYQLHDRRADPQFAAVSALAVWWTREYEAVREAFAT